MEKKEMEAIKGKIKAQMKTKTGRVKTKKNKHPR